MLCDFLWSDPSNEVVSWAESDRGVSYIFGKKVVDNFMERHNMDLVVRAHQVVAKGYEFFARRKMVTVFSAPNYMGEFDNSGAVLSVNEDLLCSFQILQGRGAMGTAAAAAAATGAAAPSGSAGGASSSTAVPSLLSLHKIASNCVCDGFRIEMCVVYCDARWVGC